MNIKILISITLIISARVLDARHPAFTFHQIAGDTTTISAIERDASGNIVNINDGKKTPLVLGSIPYEKDHIEQLKTTFSTKSNRTTASIGLVTLTENWENKAAGLSAIVKNNTAIVQCHYPTKDGAPLSFVDTLCTVHDLEHRDTRNQTLWLVHCRYGKGRSALAVAAYLAHVLHKHGITPTPDKIESYLISRRSQVRLHKGQKKALASFCSALKKAGSFESLCSQYKKDMSRKCCSK